MPVAFPNMDSRSHLTRTFPIGFQARVDPDKVRFFLKLGYYSLNLVCSQSAAACHVAPSSPMNCVRQETLNHQHILCL